MKDHPTKRLKERTTLSPRVMPRLRKLVAKKRSAIPKGSANHINLGGKGYAVVKRVGKKPVIATVLAPDMKPPGVSLNSILGIDRLREAIKTAYSPREQLHQPPPTLDPPKDRTKLKQVKPKPGSQAVDPGLNASAKPDNLVRTASINKEASSQLASAIRRSGNAAAATSEQDVSTGHRIGGGLPTPMDIIRAASGDPSQSYEAFHRSTDPRLLALIRALQSAVKE